MASHDQQHLLRVLDERDIPVNAEDVASVFEDAQTRGQAQSWIREYLTPATLLTKDELEFHRKGGALASEARDGHPYATAQFFSSDADVEAAIRALEASSAAIDEQCKVLESQKRAWDQLRSRHLPREASAPPELKLQQRGLERQRAQVDFSIDDLSQSLVERVKLAVKQADSLTGNISSNADRLFDKDDRLLDGLQKLLPLLSRPPAPPNEDIDVEKLCATLNLLSIQEIRARLDAAYVDSLAQFRRQTNGHLDVELTPQQEKQRETLRAELGELSGEIDGLVGIVVDHKYRNPIKDTQSTAHTDALAQRVSWGEYLINTLEYLAARLDKVNDHVQHIHAHRAALRAISGSLDELNAMQPPNSGPPGSSGGPKPSGKGLKPLRLVQANFSELQDPAIQLLRQLDVRNSDINDLAKFEDALGPAVRERKDKVSRLSKTTEVGVTDAVAKSLSNTEQEVSTLIRAVHAYSRSRSVSLVDGGVASSLHDLERDTQKLSEEMRGLDIDQIARSVRARQAESLQKLA